MEAHIEIDGLTRERTVVTELPGSDTEKLSFFKPVKVTQEQFELLLEEDSKERKKLVEEILACNK